MELTFYIFTRKKTFFLDNLDAVVYSWFVLEIFNKKNGNAPDWAVYVGRGSP
jgi:ribA/ribD-fused uncharacterized protein